jgi:Tfp pilus assembly protein PilV
MTRQKTLFISSGVGRRRSRRSGMSLMELIVAAMLLLPLLTVVLQNFITCMTLNANAEGTSKAIWQERALVAAIEKTPFEDIIDTYNNKKFPLVGLTGYVVTYAAYVSQADTDLVVVYISATWKDRGGRYNGEDVNLNGQLDAGEDKVFNGQPANGRLDSNVGFSTFIYNKG